MTTRTMPKSILAILFVLFFVTAVPLGSFAEGEPQGSSSAGPIDRAAKATGKGLERGANATERGIKRAGKATGRGLKRAANATERGIKKAGKATGKGLKKGGEAVERTFSGGQSPDKK